MISTILALLSIATASSSGNKDSFGILLESCDCRVDSARITEGYPNHLSFGNGTEAIFTIQNELLFQKTTFGTSELYVNGDLLSTEPGHIGPDISTPGWEVRDSVLHFKGSPEFSVCLQAGLSDFLIVGDGKNSECTDLVKDVTLRAIF